jgi:hypothetical protein
MTSFYQCLQQASWLCLPLLSPVLVHCDIDRLKSGSALTKRNLRKRHGCRRMISRQLSLSDPSRRPFGAFRTSLGRSASAKYERTTTVWWKENTSSSSSYHRLGLFQAGKDGHIPLSPQSKERNGYPLFWAQRGNQLITGSVYHRLGLFQPAKMAIYPGVHGRRKK